MNAATLVTDTNNGAPNDAQSIADKDYVNYPALKGGA